MYTYPVALPASGSIREFLGQIFELFFFVYLCGSLLAVAVPKGKAHRKQASGKV